MSSLSKLSVAALSCQFSKDDAVVSRASWDFVVDGISLRSRFPDHSDRAGVLGWGTKQSENEALSRLCADLAPDSPPNRVAIYVCPLCGDLGCGAVTVAISRSAQTVAWNDFRWEVSWYADHPDESTIRYELGPFEFDYTDYIRVLRNALHDRPEPSHADALDVRKR
jgi:hypothetical protein